MSISTEITRLQTAKTDIKNAIEAKGVTVPSDATLSTYDDYIAQITSDPSGDCTATAADVAYGKTAYSQHQLITGTMSTYNGAYKEIASIAVTTSPTKISYLEGELVDLTGLVITATYTDNTTSNITNLCTSNPASGTAVSFGLTTIQFKYAAFTTTQSITVDLPYLYFSALQANSTVWLQYNRTPFGINIEYTTDGYTWLTPTILQDAAGTVITLANIGDKVYFRGNNSVWYNDGLCRFLGSGQLKVGGKIMYLLNKQGTPTSISTYALTGVFSRNTAIVDASELIISPTIIGSYLYYYCFGACTNLLYPPPLPIQNVGSYSVYPYMFQDCTSLYVADAATTGYSQEWRVPTTGTMTSGILDYYTFQNCLGTRSSDHLSVDAGSSKTYYIKDYPTTQGG